uniref:Uncharacterized protein n=2 Tax=Oryza sativa subsp. japonica TaxID=39947 RepID=Q2R542_ORYSJ|nr:hypothetical protein LOC_Os11g26310 [Oryza sativa Japonica Group]ABA93420.1 hypothetical protein LOC_Os11g26309 [Oryza sativa Japonica Group]
MAVLGMEDTDLERIPAAAAVLGAEEALAAVDLRELLCPMRMTLIRDGR